MPMLLPDWNSNVARERKENNPIRAGVNALGNAISGGKDPRDEINSRDWPTSDNIVRGNRNANGVLAPLQEDDAIEYSRSQSSGGSSYSPTRDYSASTASQGSALGQTSTGSYSGLAPEPEPEPKPPSKKEYLANDSIYTQEQAALEAALKKLRAKYGSFAGGQGNVETNEGWTPGSLQNEYVEDFQNNLQDLGWMFDSNSWNQRDPLTSYGSAYENQLNDFAARGMLSSSAYQQALSNLNRGFNDQRSNMIQSKQDYINDLQQQWNSAFAENQQELAKAKTLALQRRANEFGL